MRRLFGAIASLLIVSATLLASPTVAGAATASGVDPTGDITGEDGTYDITGIDVTLTSTTFTATVQTAAALPALTDSSWAASATSGREIVVYLGKEFGFSGIGVVRGSAVAFGPQLNQLTSCAATASVSGTSLTVSAPASCFNNPGRVDVFAATVDLAKAASGPIDLAIAGPNPGPAATARDLSYVTTSLDARGFYQVGADGGNFAFGGAKSFDGNSGLPPLNAPIVGVSTQPHNQLGDGYRTVASDGGIFCWGDSANRAVGFYGSMGGKPLNKPIVGMATTPSGSGYWEVASDGGIFAFGDAQFYGSMGGKVLNKPIVGMGTTPSGHGYWLVASDGGIFAFGDAGFYGSAGSIKLNSPVVGIAATTTGDGYLMAARDGGVFAYGDSQFEGSGVSSFNNNVVGITNNGTDTGYYLTSSDGHVANYGTALNYGDIYSTLEFSQSPLNKPIVGMSLAGSAS